MSTEILFEAGIGESRAAVLEQGRLVEAFIERDTDPHFLPGARWTARITKALTPQPRALVMLGDVEALLEPLPAGYGEGRLLVVEMTRQALPEAGRPRLMKCSPHIEIAPLAAPAPMQAGPTLEQRLRARGRPMRHLQPHEEDALEAHGWSEILEEAMTGVVAFPQGLLTIVRTAAMTLIDVDGASDSATLMRHGVEAAVRAIALQNISGNIGIDLPTVADKALRVEAAQQVDALLPQPFERTAINGFGFLQIIRRRTHLSLPELLQSDPLAAAGHALLRRAERFRQPGARKIIAHPQLITWLENHPQLCAALTARTGVAHILEADPHCRLEAAYVARQS